MAEVGLDAVLAQLAASVGSLFTFRAGESVPGVDLALVGFEERTGSAPYMQSSAYFEGPASAALAQGTYRVEHPALGAFALFIVPIAQRGDQLRYEACFTRAR